MNEHDLLNAVAASDAAMDAVEENAGAAWREHALGVVRSLAARMGRFTTDDVMEEVALPPHDPRAIGPVMRTAVKLGVITFTGDYVPSRRRHCSPIRVWRNAR